MVLLYKQPKLGEVFVCNAKFFMRGKLDLNATELSRALVLGRCGTANGEKRAFAEGVNGQLLVRRECKTTLFHDCNHILGLCDQLLNWKFFLRAAG